MYFPINYQKYSSWFTIDVEELSDTNFNLIKKRTLELNYETLVNNWLQVCKKYNYKSTAFVLGSFALKYPNVIKKLSDAGHEISSHGLNHNLVSKIEFYEWKNSISESKKILEDITGKEVNGYRAASWSLPFETHYYETLVELGYKYSSSYFPLKTYLYGNSIDKKHPFEIHTKSGKITEIPVPKLGIPYSGGFYLRMFPSFLQKLLISKLINKGIKPVIYIHPYELIDNDYILKFYFQYFKKNIDFFLAFGATSRPLNDIEELLKLINKK